MNTSTVTAIIVQRKRILGVRAKTGTLFSMRVRQLLFNRTLRRAVWNAKQGAVYHATFENPTGELAHRRGGERLILTALTPAQQPFPTSGR